LSWIEIQNAKIKVQNFGIPLHGMDFYELVAKRFCSSQKPGKFFTLARLAEFPVETAGFDP
jgi:hypothetical protein